MSANTLFALDAKTCMNISVRVTINQTIVSIKQFGVFVAHPLDSDSVHYFLFIHNWTELVLEKHWFLTNTKWFWNRFRYRFIRRILHKRDHELSNKHYTDLLFRYLSHHLTWHCYSIYEDLHRFAQICSQNCFCYCFWTILGSQQ